MIATLIATFTLSSLAADDKPQSPELIGYCPVAYVKGKILKGSPEFASTVDGKTYWFVSADAKKLFDNNPDGYAVACDGYCAYAAAKGKVFPGDPQIFSVKDNTIYFFINQDTKKAFDNDADMANQANANWPKLAETIE